MSDTFHASNKEILRLTTKLYFFCQMKNIKSCRAFVNNKNEDLFYTNCGCDRDSLTHSYYNSLCMKITTSKKKYMPCPSDSSSRDRYCMISDMIIVSY